jgi:hypothetical protein
MASGVGPIEERGSKIVARTSNFCGGASENFRTLARDSEIFQVKRGIMKNFARLSHLSPRDPLRL